MTTTTRSSPSSGRLVARPEAYPPAFPSALVLGAASLALGAALAGLLVDGVYGTLRATSEMFRGYDLVTAAVVVPGLVLASLRAHRGSVTARLVAAGLLAALLYGEAYHLFGAGFHRLFLLQIAVFAVSLVALVAVVAGTDLGAVGARFRPDRSGVVSLVLAVLAVSLTGLWLYVGITNAATGAVPAGSAAVETPLQVHLGIALDLGLLVPLYASAAVLLERGSGWGSVLAAIALVGGLVLQVDYLVAMPFQAAAGVPGAVWTDPAEPLVVAVYLLGALMLFRPARSQPRTSGP